MAPITLRNRITNLSEALRVMAPDAAFPYLQRARARLKARSRPVRNKRLQVVPIRHLFALGVDLIRRAEAEDAERELWNASLYRDGVMILILTCRPLRRGNVAAMVLGQHLLRRGDRYVLRFDEDETKNRRPFEQPLAPQLTPMIERYLEPLSSQAPRRSDERACLDLLARQAAHGCRDLCELGRADDRRRSGSPCRRTGSATAS